MGTWECHKKFIYYIPEMACTEKFSYLVSTQELKCNVQSNSVVLHVNIKK